MAALPPLPARTRALRAGLAVPAGLWRLLPLLLAVAWPLAGAAQERWRHEDVARVVAIGDVHGSDGALAALLRQARLVDSGMRWSGGASHLVVTGDMVDRGDGSRAVLELLMRLQDEAARAGGAVHVLMGNHELMALSGDLRDVSAGDYAAFAGPGGGATSPGDPGDGRLARMRAFAPDGVLGQWLLDRPAVVVIDRTAFVHGGLSARLDGRPLEAINRGVQADARGFAEGWHALQRAGVLGPGDDFDGILAAARRVAGGGAGEGGAEVDPALRARAGAMLEAIRNLAFHPDGPLWYRGNAVCHPYFEAPRLRGLLQGIGADRLVVGHTPTLPRRITGRDGDLVTRIDTGMNAEAYGGRPFALVIEGGRMETLGADGERGVPQPESEREWARPHGLDDAGIEAFLREAAIVEVKPLAVGATRPRRVTLERGGQRMRAVFKAYDTDPGLESIGWRREHEAADRFVHELAAYHLDRLLGLRMVPVAVLREVEGRPGMLQYWVEDAVNETDRLAAGRPFEGDCALQDQHDLMNVFDVLIHNLDRNTGNILYDRDGQVWMIDHTRAFGTGGEVPPELRGAAIRVTPPMARALERVTPANLAAVAPHLNRAQVRALVQRARVLRSSR